MPSNRTHPAVAGRRRSTTRPVVDLPQPDSPTSPRVWCREISKFTPDTACTEPTWRRKIPDRTGNSLTRPLTCNSGADAGTEGSSMVAVADGDASLISSCLF